jgi:hypothetical protein
MLAPARLQFLSKVLQSKRNCFCLGKLAQCSFRRPSFQAIPSDLMKSDEPSLCGGFWLLIGAKLTT